MAAGVPETDVFKAADAVLTRGERPTVERVRTELGRGSPARVGQLLEQWWEQLAQRLKGHALLPELPGEVAQAFAEAWRLALMHAATSAEAALTEQQNTLFAEQTSLTQERKLWEIALTAAQADLAEGMSKLAQTELQLAERQGLVDQLVAQAADTRHQRDQLQGQLERRQTELDALRAELIATQAHIRAAEDRAHQEVDQARQELKALGQKQERARHEHAKRLAGLTTERDALRAGLRAAEQTLAHQAGQVSALEAAIKQWRPTQTANSKHTTRKTPTTPTAKPRRQRVKMSP
ncbi:DNA-binding protein [Dyella japonica]|uniref:DNA-binding protein n=1 Tax=Dyella japonica TaxID=231455 RepID=UPI0003706956|nr:DNA-binding protein [Dyella japonica]